MSTALGTTAIAPLMDALKNHEPVRLQGAHLDIYPDDTRLRLRIFWSGATGSPFNVAQVLAGDNLPSTWRETLGRSDLSTREIQTAFLGINDYLRSCEWWLVPYPLEELLLSEGVENVTHVNGLQTVSLNFTLHVPALRLIAVTDPILLGEALSPNQLSELLAAARA